MCEMRYSSTPLNLKVYHTSRKGSYSNYATKVLYVSANLMHKSMHNYLLSKPGIWQALLKSKRFPFQGVIYITRDLQKVETYYSANYIKIILL